MKVKDVHPGVLLLAEFVHKGIEIRRTVAIVNFFAQNGVVQKICHEHLNHSVAIVGGDLGDEHLVGLGQLAKLLPRPLHQSLRLKASLVHDEHKLCNQVQKRLLAGIFFGAFPEKTRLEECPPLSSGPKARCIRCPAASDPKCMHRRQLETEI